MQASSPPRKHRQKAAHAKSPIKGKKRHHHIDSGGLNENLGYHLRLAYLAISRHFATAMSRLDLTQKQTGVLWLIGANSGVSQIAIAIELGMDRASMMAIVDRLQERGLIKRERSKHDGRRQELYLTPKGRRVLGQSKIALARHEQWMTSRFSPSELVALTDFLVRIHK